MRKSSKSEAPRAQNRGSGESPPKATSGGLSVSKNLPLTDGATDEKKRRFIRAVLAGLADLEAGREISLAEAKARLDL